MRELRNEQYRQFWTEVQTDNGLVIEIINSDLIIFLEERGYRKLVHKTSFQLVKIEHGSIVKPIEVFMVRDEIKDFLKQINRKDVWDEFLRIELLSKRIVEGLDSVFIDFNYGDDNTAVFFYKNGVLKVTATELQITSYEDYDGYVWQDHILDRSFTETDSINAEFRTFCLNLSNHNNDRFISLISIIGYLLHSYKDPSLTKSVILIDENIDIENDQSQGGTGKSLLAEAIGKIIPTLRKNGKNLKTTDKFFFADVEPHHKLIVFDDVKIDFPFELLYSMITGDMPIEKKYKNPTVMGFKDVPKTLITSNYIVSGTGGNSEQRRKVEFEVSSHYRENQSILEEFGHRFFDDWSIEEWLLFDNFMISNVQIFLNNGIIEPESININRNRLIQDTNLQFVSHLNAVLEDPQQFGGEVRDSRIRFNKAHLYRNFIRANPECNDASPIKFKKWIDLYSNINNIPVAHQKSNGNAYVIFTINQNQES